MACLRPSAALPVGVQWAGHHAEHIPAALLIAPGCLGLVQPARLTVRASLSSTHEVTHAQIDELCPATIADGSPLGQSVEMERVSQASLESDCGIVRC